MSRELVIGLDLGTTSAKAVVFNLQGNVVAEAEEMITSYYPQTGWVEQDPNEIERLAVLAVRSAVEKAQIKEDELLTVGFSSAMHSLICVDHDGDALGRAIIWADGRSTEQAEKLKQLEGFKLYQKTGMPNHPMSPLTKLIWMKENRYEPYQQAAHFMSIKEFVILKWFGQRVVDFAMASATGLFNLNSFQWDEEALEIAAVSKEQLSTIVPPTECIKGFKSEIAMEMGINVNVPFVIGSADGQLANLGIGAILPGEVAITAGTSGAIRQFSKNASIDHKHETFCYAFSKEYSIIGGPTNNGGIALQWLKELLNYEGSFDELTKEAEQVLPGAEGILFHPYINGERAPLWNQQAKGNFFGVTITHKKQHFVRAVLEGITFNLYQIGQALERIAGEPNKLYVNGGLSRSPLWLQMLADVFDKEVYVPESHHSAAWGAAWTGLVSIGKVDSFEEIKKNVPMGDVIKPNKQNHLVYKEIYSKYEKLGRDLSKYF
ncbi:gluconokinase [Halalkalibacter krulwichiae]|uniref:Xylulose kinase n=1 Tax=Halalkalibacter krulwichiae TaxID=199441 RepID=A0A1X9MF33_9BACI|nr:gluconokinase [Halalkalibacter krulwichiae]ARK31254.1 Xylulose kinase [Halalkalibacter krulwichiae]